MCGARAWPADGSPSTVLGRRLDPAIEDEAHSQAGIRRLEAEDPAQPAGKRLHRPGIERARPDGHGLPGGQSAAVVAHGQHQLPRRCGLGERQLDQPLVACRMGALQRIGDRLS